MSKALSYAEDTLKVHEVYEDSKSLRNKLNECLTQLSDLRDKKRTFEYAIADREQELIQREWMNNPDMAQNRMDKHVKQVIQSDSFWRLQRTALAETLSEIDGLECDKSIVEVDLKIAVSRMLELGGYFNYLAAVKQAASTEKSTTPES